MIIRHQAASLRVATDRLVVHLPYAHAEGGDVTLKAIGEWEPAAGQTGVTLTATEGGYRLRLAPGVVRAVMARA